MMLPIMGNSACLSHRDKLASTHKRHSQRWGDNCFDNAAIESFLDTLKAEYFRSAATTNNLR